MSESFLKTYQPTILISLSILLSISIIYYVYKSTYGLKLELQNKCSQYDNVLKHHDSILQELSIHLNRKTHSKTKVTLPPKIIMNSFTPTLQTIIEEEEEEIVEEDEVVEEDDLDRELEEELQKIKNEQSV